MTVTVLKKRRNANPTLINHEERITSLEDLATEIPKLVAGEISGMFDMLKKRLTQWGLALLAGFAASGLIDGRAATVIGTIIKTATGG